MRARHLFQRSCLQKRVSKIPSQLVALAGKGLGGFLRRLVLLLPMVLHVYVYLTTT